jgi:hypothetical protein
MKTENDIEALLSKVNMVEVSPFLITRIKQQISAGHFSSIAPIYLKRMAIIGSLALLLNMAGIYFKQIKHSENAFLLDAFNLNNENNLILKYE